MFKSNRWYKSLYKLANIVLKHIYFELGKDAYHQILGTAIGRKFAPHYANIFMAGHPYAKPFEWNGRAQMKLIYNVVDM